MKTKNRIAYYSLGGFFVLLIDQWLKFFARENQSFTYYIIKPHFGWEFFANSGIAFSLPIPSSVLIIITPLIILGLLILLTRHYRSKIFSLGLILIIAGAISNLIDRFIFAVTIDYIRVFTSVFNLADISIVTGAVLLLISPPKKVKTNPSSTSDSFSK